MSGGYLETVPEPPPLHYQPTALPHVFAIKIEKDVGSAIEMATLYERQLPNFMPFTIVVDNYLCRIGFPGPLPTGRKV